VKSIKFQAAAIAERWPALELKEISERSGRWVGPLTVHTRTYTVEITYEVPMAAEHFSLSQAQPRVRVLSPPLQRHPDYELGPLPHVYWTRKGPVLCLFDPDQWEWTPEDLLAETTVPWALRWLLFYEGWLATKRWFGGGRDHDSRIDGELKKDASSLRRRHRWLASAATLA
jgi:hypothetical protein